MSTQTIIDAAVEFILGKDIMPIARSDDRHFLRDIIIRISETLERGGYPSNDILNLSIAIGELTREDCQDGVVTLYSSDRPERRDAYSLLQITYHVYSSAFHASANELEPVDLDEFAHKFNFDVCQACPIFISAVHKVHRAGFTPERVFERAKDYTRHAPKF